MDPVIVQDQALRAANDRIQQLEAQVRDQQPAPQENTSFLGGLGRSIFGQPEPASAQGGRPVVPTTGGHGPGPLPQEPGPFRNQGAAPAGPWGGGADAAGGAAPSMAGGGFLKGALGAAAGVAGGVLLADGIRGLFGGGNNPFGIASGMGGGMGAGAMGAGGLGNPGGETIVNNYYDSPNQGADSVDYGGDQGGDLGGDNADPGGYGGGYSRDV